MIIQSKNVWINEQFQPAQVEVSEQRMIMVGMVGMPIMPIMNLSKSGKLTFQKKGLQLFYQQRQQHFQKTWNIHLK